MKSVTQIKFIIAAIRNIGIAVVILGFLIKIMHWERSTFYILIGASGIISSSLFKAFFIKTDKLNNWLLFLLFSSWVISALLKIFHLLYQFESLIAACGLTVVYVLMNIFKTNESMPTKESDLLNSNIGNSGKVRLVFGQLNKTVFKKFTKTLLILGVSGTSLGVGLKIFHWPFANVFLIIGAAVLSFYFLFKTHKEI